MGGTKKEIKQVDEFQIETDIVNQHELESNLADTVKRKASNDFKGQIIGIVSALIPVLALFGIQFDWLNVTNATMIYTLVSGIVFLAINIYSIWKNHYTSKKAQEQLYHLKKKGLK